MKVLGVKKTISIKGVISFNLSFLNKRITNNIIEIIMAINIGTSRPQPITGVHKWGPVRDPKSNQSPIAELSTQVIQYFFAITRFSFFFITGNSKLLIIVNFNLTTLVLALL